MTINNHIVQSQKQNILCAITEEKEDFSISETNELKSLNADCIMVLGAGIRDDETPTPMLKDRLDTGIRLYELGTAPKLLLTGDNGQVGHNEIHVMLNYVKKAGVPEEDIFCDHAGFSTYDSMYRAQSIFGAERLIVVTQTYHEYRALYVGEKLGLTVKGVAADQMKYRGQAAREIREVLARVKDFLKVMAKPESELGGEAIPINGNGLITHGE
ncbi:SanA/YdcF family protein [Ihubacter sp. rT4E-8]|uniref:SanA/YdcF family protein n=1 Tax=unclassified Ihubacter TaxID=2633299 RepID=UPI00137B02AB